MKRLLVFTLVVLSLFVTSTPAFATEITHTNGNQSFDHSWALFDSDTNWVMEYGFNMDWINEDYTHTKHNSVSHTAVVINDNGEFPKSGQPGQWAKIEVRHNGTTITYQLKY